MAVFRPCRAAAAPNVVSDSVGSNYPFWDKVENGQGAFTPPEGSVTIVGKIIGGKFGWDDNPGTGAAQAFNGNLGDVYDMNENWDSGIVWDDQYAGIWADEPYILTCFRVLPTTDADWQAERLNLAAVQGSNDGVNWTTLYQFDHAATVGDTNFIEVTQFENNTGYTMFRYKRLEAHTDCRELEFYGYVVGSQSGSGTGTDQNPTTSDVTVIGADDIDLTNVMEAKTYSDGEIFGMKLPYRIYLPESYSESGNYCLLIHIHGAGERGSNNIAQIAQKDQTELIRRILGDDELSQKFIIIAPQCPSNSIWVTMDWGPGTYSIDAMQQTVPMKLLVSLLQNEILENYAIDPDRIYVTGISAGGFATWDLICRYPDLFAAAIPVCGGCDATYAEAIKDIPIRIYHSSDDTIVSDAGSRQMYEELKKLGADVEFYDTKPWGHGAWGKAYAEKDLLSWMMSKVRPVRPDNTETVTTAELTETANPESSGSRLEEAASSEGMAETETNGMTGLWVIVVSCVIVFAVAAVIFVSVKKAGKKKRT